ncbi:hypothetical protein HYH02_000885 [Chlamydomonas schloesseri]|uniref:Ammonium transporter n=1 Tax=Chlamydomonas schloesseri TaxID=2026947 RepID=A0A836BDX5_9CHLO|nr:hypothetical protein HYH02_000885 [Chlamydomonas schloesseri]|eukprot:KAG2455060.1 hypothetical protein HYH02_000885 [Chlamydomonas schloesseri]
MSSDDFGSEPLGSCSVATIASLLAYGLDQDTITGLCQPEEGNGCTSTDNCMFQYLMGATADAQSAASNVSVGLDVSFLLFSGYLVFIMQLGFAVLCAGCIRSKNCMNILLKNMLDACVGAIGFYLFGYAFAYGRKYGQNSNGFIGNWNFALSYTTETSMSGTEFTTFGWHQFFFQWSFCAATTTIVSGAVAERCTFSAYMTYAFFLSSFVYPVVVHWVWDSQGWLSAFNTFQDGYALILKTGAIDFAGSGVVHMTGGVAALMGAAIIGPRIGRFAPDGSVNEMKGHSSTLVVMGTFLLWFGWFGFNPGSNLVVASQAAATVVSRVAVTTALAGGAGGISMLFYKFLTVRAWDVVATCNGILAGLVAVTASCSVIEPWAAIITGAIGAIVFSVADYVTLNKLKVDDPVSAFALHGAVGAWGVLFPGFLAAPHYVVEVYGAYGFGMDAEAGKRFGLFYGGHGQVLLVQVIEVLAIFGWTGFMMGGFFFIMNLVGLLRVSMQEEMTGLDITNHTKRAGSASQANGGKYESHESWRRPGMEPTAAATTSSSDDDTERADPK